MNISGESTNLQIAIKFISTLSVLYIYIYIYIYIYSCLSLVWCAVCKLERLGFSVVLLMVSVLVSGTVKPDSFPKKMSYLCKTRAPYCLLQRVWLYQVFPHYPISEMIFVKKIIGPKMCVSIFSTMFVCNISYYKKTNRNIIINVHRSSCNFNET